MVNLRFLSVLDNILSSAENENYKGYDPYDGLSLNLPLLNTAKKSLLGRLFLIHLNKRFIKNLRPIMGIHKDVNAKAVALFLSGSIKLNFYKNAENLNAAQEAKLDLICRKLGLKPGMRVLDIGCGWGGFAKFAAETYDVSVLGITVSREQVEYANRCCRAPAVEIKFQDYRTLNDMFDRIISIGMFEHVGSKNYRTYMQVVHRCLAPDGLFLLHTIAGNTSVSSTDPWISKYIFPNSMLPSAKQITSAAEGLFVLEDWHSFGPYYDDTLMAWYANFKANWDKIKDAYDRRFFRMWTYYLLSCAGSFRARRNQLWQIVFSKTGVSGGYTGIR